MKFRILKSLDGVLKNGKGAGGMEKLVAFGVFQGEESSFLKEGGLKGFEFIGERIKHLDFKAKRDKSVAIESPVYSAVYGLGKRKHFSYDSIRLFASAVSKIARSSKTSEIILVIPGLDSEYYLKNGLFYLSAAVSEGISLGLYEFKKYMSSNNGKAKEKAAALSEASVCFGKAKISRELEDSSNMGFDFGLKTSSAVNFARDIVNEPGNVANPEYLAKIASKISSGTPNISCEIFDEKEILKMGMNAFYGVARGSKNPPRFIHLTYNPGGKPKAKAKKTKKIAIIGKGLTFDSGGLSLKPADFMVTMKSDKSGACAVLGVMNHIADLGIDLEVHAIIAACENMPDGGAQRPDDIVKAMNGKTIEIDNTDAEGRLTLADALTFASKLGVDEIIDLATLTGACVVALGEYTSGVMGNDKGLIESVLASGNISGERLWELPFDENMREKLSSPIADLKNVGNRYGGAITAGMFLEEFVPEKIKWCHIDIAGPSFTKTGFTYNPKGGTGAGVRTLLYYLYQHKS